MRSALFLLALACLCGCKDRAEPTRRSAPEQQGPPRDREGIDLRIDPALPLAMRFELQAALDRGVPLQRVDLFEGIRKGLVVATATGGGLRSAMIRLELKSKHVLAVDVPATTYLGSRSGSVQNMVVLTPTTAWLWPEASTQEIGVPVACANMPLDAPGGKDDLVVQPLPSKAPKWQDLRKLITSPEFANADQLTQQFAVWTVTENPATRDAIKPIQVSPTLPNGVRLPPSANYPNFDSIHALFEKAKIELTRYAVFSKSPKEGQVSAERLIHVQLYQVEESRAEAEAAVYKQALAAKRTPAEAKALVEAAEGPKRLNEVAAAFKRAGDATRERMSAEKKAYDEAKAKGVWEDKAVQAGEDRARPLARAEAEARAEADALYKRWASYITARLRE